MNISNLNDDCLLEIFKYLSKLEKLKFSLVCRKWGSYLLKNLEIDDQVMKEYKTNGANEEKFTNFLINILKKCGSNMNTLIISGYFEDFLNDEEISSIILKVSKYCKNIVEINISSSEPVWLISNLDLLFKSNVHLHSLSLKNLRIEGNCFTKLQPLKIEKFELWFIDFDSENYLIKFISKLKNVKIFHIATFDTVKDTTDIIRSLDFSNCENISDFSLNDCQTIESMNELGNLLLKQKNLRKIKLFEVNVDDNFLDKLPKNNLEVLSFNMFNENLSLYSLSKFQNLKSLICAPSKLTDEVMNGLKECTQLKELFVDVSGNCLLSKKGESYFSNFQSLESFRIHFSIEQNIDNILIALIQCRNLEKISFSYLCKFTDVGFNSLCLYENLKYLRIPYSNVTDDQLINLVKNAKKLVQINIDSCKNVTNRFIEVASEIKQQRNDKNYLTIIYMTKNEKQDEIYCTKINIKSLKNISSMILLKINNENQGFLFT